MDFGEKLKLLLRKEGINQTELSSEIGMNYNQMSNYISGYRDPSLRFIGKIIKRFPEIDLNWLLRDEEGESNIVNQSNKEYSKPDTPEILIEEIESKLEKLKSMMSQK